MFMSKAKFLATSVIALVLTFSSFVKAHIVEQFYTSYEPESGLLLVNFDVAYAMPDIRDVVEAPQPKREWLVQQSDARHSSLRNEAEHYLRSYVQFEFNGDMLDFRVEFPDFDQTPYDFPKLLNSGAYYNVRLIPVLKKSLSDSNHKFIVSVKDGVFPNLLIAHEKEGEEIFKTIKPSEQLDLNDFFPQKRLTKHEQHETTEVSFSAWSLLVLGFEHVIPEGLDHILFIIGMCLIAANVRQLLWQSLVFTVAHTLSMGLVVSQVLPVYSYVISNYIEAIIALSIAFIAVESIVTNKYLKWRYLIIGVFGFVHGLGFAGALGSTLQFLRAEDWVAPLIFANIGIEIAQVFLVIACFGTLLYLKKTQSVKFVRVFRSLIAISIACCGLIWFFLRLP